MENDVFGKESRMFARFIFTLTIVSVEKETTNIIFVGSLIVLEKAV